MVPGKSILNNFRYLDMSKVFVKYQYERDEDGKGWKAIRVRHAISKLDMAWKASIGYAREVGILGRRILLVEGDLSSRGGVQKACGRSLLVSSQISGSTSGRHHISAGPVLIGLAGHGAAGNGRPATWRCADGYLRPTKLASC